MTTLAGFIKQCLSEDKYGHTYVNELEDRLRVLNYAQLNAMHMTLQKSSAEAKVHVWKNANDTLIVPVSKWLAIRKAEHEEELAREQEVLARYRKRQFLKEVRKKEERDVIVQLRTLAHKDAETEVRNFETEKRANDKLALLKTLPVAEERRSKHFKIAFGVLLVGIVGSIILIPGFLFMLGGIGFSVFVVLYICYRGYKVGQVHPIVYDENDVLVAIQLREEELFAQSMNLLEKRNRDFENTMASELAERRQRKLLRRMQLEAESAAKADSKYGSSEEGKERV